MLADVKVLTYVYIYEPAGSSEVVTLLPHSDSITITFLPPNSTAALIHTKLTLNY